VFVLWKFFSIRQSEPATWGAYGNAAVWKTLAGDVFTTPLGKPLAWDGVYHIPTSTTARGREKALRADILI